MQHASPITSHAPGGMRSPLASGTAPTVVGLGLFVTALLLIQAATPGWAADRPIFTRVEVYRNSANLTWSAVPGATSYLIDQVNPEGAFETVATVRASPGNPKSETWKWRKGDTRKSLFSYRVVPLDRDGVRFPLDSEYASFDTDRCPVALTKLTIESTRNALNTLTLNVDDRGNGEKPLRLVVQRYRDGATEYEKLLSLQPSRYPNSLNMSFAHDRDLVPGVTYRYKARQVISEGIYTYSSNYISGGNSAATQALTQPSILYFSSQKGSATLFWDYADRDRFFVDKGRSSHQIEKQSVTGSWERVGTTTDTSYTVSNLKTNPVKHLSADYKFRVRTVFKGGYSPWSEISVPLQNYNGTPSVGLEILGGDTVLRWEPPNNLPPGVTVNRYLIQWMVRRNGVYQEDRQSVKGPNERFANAPHTHRSYTGYGESAAFVTAILSDGVHEFDSNRFVVDTSLFSIAN